MKKPKESQNWGIIGHESVVGFLAHNIGSSHVHHAYALVGPARIGKGTIVTKAIQAILCSADEALRPCGECLPCQQVARGTHPDIVTIHQLTDEKTGKLKSNISVEQVRELKERLSLGSLTGQWSIGVIDGANTLNSAGANALLKLLEEPHANVVLWLIAESLDDIPATIQSRCHVLRCELVKRATISTALIARGATTDQAQLIAALTAGRPGMALDYYHQPARLADRQAELLGRWDTLNLSTSEQFRELAGTMKGVEDGNLLAHQLLADWTDLVRAVLLWRAAGNTPDAEHAPEWLIDRFKTSTLGTYPLPNLQNFLRRCERGHELLGANVAAPLVLEHTLLALAL